MIRIGRTEPLTDEELVELASEGREMAYRELKSAADLLDEPAFYAAMDIIAEAALYRAMGFFSALNGRFMTHGLHSNATGDEERRQFTRVVVIHDMPSYEEPIKDFIEKLDPQEKAEV